MTVAKFLEDSELLDRVAVVVGTRPGIVKMSPVIRSLDSAGIDTSVIHTGQHYSYDMDQQIFEDIELRTPDYHIAATKECYYHGEQTAEMLRGVEQALLDLRPRVVLVCGDANTNLAAGLAARKLRLVVGHVESGLRSGDWRMPEEHNRVMLDHISELLFAPTKATQANLKEDGVRGTVFLTGNTIVDAVFQHRDIAMRRSRIMSTLALKTQEYVLMTAHREENVDDAARFSRVLSAVQSISQGGRRIVFPAHPRTRRRIEEFGLWDTVKRSGVELIDPVGFLDFLQLLSNAELVLTDSGGIQEEACILHVPCVTLRENTERPETIEVGANRLCGDSAEEVAAAVGEARDNGRDWPNPLGDGRAAERIVRVVGRVLAGEDWRRLGMDSELA